MPLISVFTPFHKADISFLRELYRGLKEQSYKNWEWVLIPNNEARKADLSEFLNDVRIKVYEFNGTKGYVGELKKFACTKATGDYLVEVDWDDIITQDCLEEIRKAFEDSEVGFVYSNSCNFTGDFQATKPYSSDWGWKIRPYNYKGHPLIEHVAFKNTPASVSRIWYCPNHVRAWRKDVYEKAGGHSDEMRVLDDQDLIARTYLVTKFKHIDKCLYLYRITGENTWLKYNKEIQDNVYRLYDKYIYQIVSKWATEKGLLKIDLGGRFSCPQGYESVDLKDANINCDLNEKWPFEDNSIGVIRAHDILEHLKNPIHAMKEAYRVLAPGGYFMIMVPSTDGRGAYQDPTHISFWNQNSFFYYTRKEQAKYINTPVRFQEMRLYSTNPNEWCKKNYICYVVAHLIALKDGMIREPGLINI